MAKDRSRLYVLFRRHVRWPLEAVGFYAWIGLCAALPVETASNFGGWLGRTIGPRTGLTRRAIRNLRVAFPEKERAELDRIVVEMWDNLGRTAAEYAHLRTITDPANGRVEIHGDAHIRPAFEARKPGIAVSGHFANWEVMHLRAAHHARICTTIVRDPNNHHIRRLLEARRNVQKGARAPKGAEGARAAMATLKQNGLVAMLVDQRMSDGIAAPFFGHPAMSPPAAARMALRFDALLFPVHLERLGPARFRLTVQPPLTLPREGSRAARVLALTTELNRHLETWIRERPAEWLWLHRRWPKEVYRELGV